jgi:hypothetical protein
VTCTAYIPAATSNPLTILTDSLPSGTQKTAYDGQVSAAGGTPGSNLFEPGYIFSVSEGSLPPGLSLQASTGYIRGKPKIPGTYTFSVEATDAADSQTSQSFSVSVAPDKPVSIKTKNLAHQNAENAPYTATLAASNGTAPYSWSVSDGPLPTGLSLGTDGTITGVPTATGLFTFTVEVTDSSTPNGMATKSFTIAVKATD